MLMLNCAVNWWRWNTAHSNSFEDAFVVFLFIFPLPVALYLTLCCIFVSYLFRVVLDTVSLLSLLLCSSYKWMTIELSVGNCRIVCIWCFFFLFLYAFCTFFLSFKIVLYSFRSAAENLYWNCHACQNEKFRISNRWNEPLYFTGIYLFLRYAIRFQKKWKISRIRNFCKLFKDLTKCNKTIFPEGFLIIILFSLPLINCFWFKIFSMTTTCIYCKYSVI